MSTQKIDPVLADAQQQLLPMLDEILAASMTLSWTLSADESTSH